MHDHTTDRPTEQCTLFAHPLPASLRLDIGIHPHIPARASVRGHKSSLSRLQAAPTVFQIVTGGAQIPGLWIPLYAHERFEVLD